jgi:hypothetical protein
MYYMILLGSVDARHSFIHIDEKNARSGDRTHAHCCSSS